MAVLFEQTINKEMSTNKTRKKMILIKWKCEGELCKHLNGTAGYEK
jgi:hypothetical protein